VQKTGVLATLWAVVFSFSLIFAIPLGICQETEKIGAAFSDVETPYQPTQSSLFQTNVDLQLKQLSGFVSLLDSWVGRINRQLSKFLFHDFGTSKLKMFGAADIQRQSAQEFFGDKYSDLFAVQVPTVFANFGDRYERLPLDLVEANAALTEAGLALPEVPQGVGYDYDGKKGEFLVKPHGFGIPFIAAWLVFGGAFLTLRMRLINLRGILHALALLSGRYDSSAKIGQLNHFQTFTTSLASAVGLGSISGAAIAVCLGGPGAAFWIMVCGLLAMSTKFTECTLGQIYRRVDAEGVVLGGPMRYLQSGFKLRRLVGFSLAPFGTLLSWLFAALCICVSLTAGNTLQVSQSLGSLQTAKGFEFLRTDPWIFGVFMVVAVAIVVFGGVRLIGRVTSWLAPLMCLVYICACSWVLIKYSANLETAFGAIFMEAYKPKALFSGSFIGVMIIGVTRASLTTDAGLGTASIAHAAARTDEPIREGIVSLLEPLLGTVLMCLLTTLAIGVSGVAETAEGQALAAKEQGIAIIMNALTNGMPDWFAYTLQAALFLFAFSTCITWAYFGERCVVSLFGDCFSHLYLIVFVAFSFLGSVLSAANIMQFSGLLMLTLAIPNLVGVLLLNKVVLEELDDYWKHYQARKHDKS
jgi:alanine or glycine:cation symporter, AGCS family